jgi:glutathionyl-hydroquinone reductase
MGLLVDGVWQDDVSRTKDGHFIRPAAQFRNWVTPDGSAGPSGEDGFAAESGRYHLYVSLACPWAHRTIIFRKLKGLENVISLSIVSPHVDRDGVDFQQSGGLYRRRSLRQKQIVGNLPARLTRVLRSRQCAGFVGQEAQDDRQQRIARDHPHAQLGVRRTYKRPRRLLSGKPACRDRSFQRDHLSEYQ